MKFGKIQQRKFGTHDGAYSEVTEREHHDSQITLTDDEAKLVNMTKIIAFLYLGSAKNLI